MLPVVEDLQVSFQVGCKLCHMSLSLLEDNMVIPRTLDDIITNLSALLQILTEYHISMGSHLSSSLKRQYIMVVLLSKVAMLELDPINLNSMELTSLRIAMLGPQHNRFKGWFLASP
jgi:hypothetical protein